jgi:hypothetical protein
MGAMTEMPLPWHAPTPKKRPGTRVPGLPCPFGECRRYRQKKKRDLGCSGSRKSLNFFSRIKEIRKIFYEEFTKNNLLKL